VPSTCTAACAGVLLPYQSACADMLGMNGLTDTVADVVATCPQQRPGNRWPGNCVEADAATLCRGWDFEWDEARKTCTAGGH
jgi:hypothetical protein